MAETRDALEAIRDIITSAAAAGQSAIAGAWVYPSQYSDIDLKGNLPAIIVSETVANLNQWGIKSSGVSFHRWRAEIFLVLFEGEPVYPSSQSAAAELLQEGWAKAIAAKLIDDLTLNDTVVKIGEPDGDFPLKIFDYMIEYMQWNQLGYWGIRFEVPITQTITQTMSV